MTKLSGFGHVLVSVSSVIFRTSCLWPALGAGIAMFRRKENTNSLQNSGLGSTTALLIQEEGRQGDKKALEPVIYAATPRPSERRALGWCPAFVRYSSIGGFATAMHYVVLMILVEWFYVAPSLAAASGAACGALIAYAGNRQFTFASRSRHRITLPRFLLVAVLGTALNGAIVWVGTAALSWHYLVAQVAASLCALLITYRLNRTWTFI